MLFSSLNPEALVPPDQAVLQKRGRMVLRSGDRERRTDGATAAGQGRTFKGRHVTAEVTLWALR
ncbi:MAG: hypothetical protein ACREFY_14705 [Acetobacteraceae bacterium]